MSGYFLNKRYRKYLRRLIRARLLVLFLHMVLFICSLEIRLLANRQQKNNKRALIIIFGGLGDCLLFDPFLRRFKEHYGNVEIDVLSGGFETMWRSIGTLDHLMIFNRNTWKFPFGYFRLFRHIYRQNYDFAIEGLAMMPTNGAWSMLSALFIKAAHAKHNYIRPNTGKLVANEDIVQGFKGVDDIKEYAFNALKGLSATIIELPPPNEREDHEAYYVAKACEINYFRNKNEPYMMPPPQGVNYIKQVTKLTGMTRIAILVETTYPLKAWPMSNHIELIHRLLADSKCQIFLIGSQRIELDHNANEDEQLLNFTASTNLSQLISLLSECDLFIGADTGPAHIAQALGIPSVVLFGPSNEKEFGPVNLQLHRVITPKEELHCRPCVLGPCIFGSSCMTMITIDEVYSEVLATIEHIKKNKSHDKRTRAKCRKPIVVTMRV